MHMMHNYANKVTDTEYNMFMSAMHVSVSKHLWDEHFTVLWANHFFYELIGYSQEEYTALYHNHVDEYFSDEPNAVSWMGQIIRTAYNNGELGYEFECAMPSKSGKKVWIRVTGRFTDEVFEGLPVIYAIYTDITDLKEMQLKLENTLHEAEEANRAKSEFLSRMSHDIRTPMNAIVGMTEIASAHLDDPEKVQSCLKKISFSSHHLLGLINDILDMSKIESGKMAPNISDLSLPEVIDNTVTIMQPTVRERKQQFSVRLVNVHHEHFRGDSLRLRQIFINILSNACKFTPTGGAITLEVREQPTDHEEIALMIFVVEDTGIGMRPEFVDHIFDVFTREQDSRVDKTEGSGLGMAITKKIIDMLGGTISVESRLGVGSKFTVKLPFKIDDNMDEDLSLPDKRILVVDDDLDCCAYTVNILEQCGAAATWKNSGPEAVREIKKAKEHGRGYDAVILDWKMPGMDGEDTALSIRKEVGEAPPLIMCSAYDWTEIEDRARAAGINGFLQKPLFRSTLILSLKKYLYSAIPIDESKSQGIPFTGRRFLLVEDNELNREIACELLSAAGGVVECAVNGYEGLKKVASTQEGYYDLILMDIQMPVMNGYTATRKIRELQREDVATLPIVAMTADAFTEDIDAALKAGMNGHIAKPLDVGTMERIILEIIDRSTEQKVSDNQY